MEGALLALDVKTGAVRAMVGGYDFEKSKFNRATQAMRQVGSAFKPIVYAAALETLGYTPATILVDSPLSFPNPWNGTVWTPQNYDGAYLGPDPAAQGDRAEPQHPRRAHAPGGRRREGHRVRAQARPRGRAAALPADRARRRRGDAHRDDGRLRDLRQPGPAHEAVPDRRASPTATAT